MNQITTFTRKHRTWVGAGIALALIVLLLWIFRDRVWAALQLGADQEALAALLDQYGAFGIAISVLLLVLQVFLAVIPGQALVIVNGYVYGFWKGLLITWTTVVLASEVAFWLARRYGRPLATHFVAPKTLKRWDGWS